MLGLPLMGQAAKETPSSPAELKRETWFGQSTKEGRTDKRKRTLYVGMLLHDWLKVPIFDDLQLERELN